MVEEGAAKPKRKPLPLPLSVLLNFIAALVVISLVQTFWVKVYSVPSGSMEETLQVGDRILVNRLAYSGNDIEQGDEVVFRGDSQWGGDLPSPSSNPLSQAVRAFGDLTNIGPSNERALVKRVIGLPGQEVDCCSDGGSLTVDGEALDEPYIASEYEFHPGELDCDSEPRSNRCFEPVQVPEGKLLVLGDNRANSADSVIYCRGQYQVEGTANEAAEECIRWVEEDDVVGEVTFTIWPPTQWSRP